MTNAPRRQNSHLQLKYLRPGEVAEHLRRDPRLILPVGTTEQHGPHLPLGCDTVIVERLADDLSAEFRVLRAPTVEYGVNAPVRETPPGHASVRRKTLHRFLNDLIGDWEAGGVRQFILLTAHGHDPHQEALSTIRTRAASVRSVDIFAMPLPEGTFERLPIHGGEIDTSLLMYLDWDLVDLERAQDYLPTRRELRRFRRATAGRLPSDGPGSMGRPSQASIEKGERLYQFIYDRIARHVFRIPQNEAVAP
jgi:creatinine amidohydrolase